MAGGQGPTLVPEAEGPTFAALLDNFCHIDGRRQKEEEG